MYNSSFPGGPPGGAPQSGPRPYGGIAPGTATGVPPTNNQGFNYPQQQQAPTFYQQQYGQQPQYHHQQQPSYSQSAQSQYQQPPPLPPPPPQWGGGYNPAAPPPPGPQGNTGAGYHPGGVPMIHSQYMPPNNYGTHNTGSAPPPPPPPPPGPPPQSPQHFQQPFNQQDQQPFYQNQQHQAPQTSAPSQFNNQWDSGQGHLSQQQQQGNFSAPDPSVSSGEIFPQSNGTVGDNSYNQHAPYQYNNLQQQQQHAPTPPLPPPPPPPPPPAVHSPLVPNTPTSQSTFSGGQNYGRLYNAGSTATPPLQGLGLSEYPHIQANNFQSRPTPPPPQKYQQQFNQPVATATPSPPPKPQYQPPQSPLLPQRFSQQIYTSSSTDTPAPQSPYSQESRPSFQAQDDSQESRPPPLPSFPPQDDSRPPPLPSFPPQDDSRPPPLPSYPTQDDTRPPPLPSYPTQEESRPQISTQHDTPAGTAYQYPLASQPESRPTPPPLPNYQQQFSGPVSVLPPKHSYQTPSPRPFQAQNAPLPGNYVPQIGHARHESRPTPPPLPDYQQQFAQQTDSAPPPPPQPPASTYAPTPPPKVLPVLTPPKLSTSGGAPFVGGPLSPWEYAAGQTPSTLLGSTPVFPPAQTAAPVQEPVAVSQHPVYEQTPNVPSAREPEKPFQMDYGIISAPILPPAKSMESHSVQTMDPIPVVVKVPSVQTQSVQTQQPWVEPVPVVIPENVEMVDHGVQAEEPPAPALVPDEISEEDTTIERLQELDAFYQDSITRFIVMIESEAVAESDSEKLKVFTEFMEQEYFVRGQRYPLAIERPPSRKTSSARKQEDSIIPPPIPPKTPVPVSVPYYADPVEYRDDYTVSPIVSPPASIAPSSVRKMSTSPACQPVNPILSESPKPQLLAEHQYPSHKPIKHSNTFSTPDYSYDEVPASFDAPVVAARQPDAYTAFRPASTGPGRDRVQSLGGTYTPFRPPPDSSTGRYPVVKGRPRRAETTVEGRVNETFLPVKDLAGEGRVNETFLPVKDLAGDDFFPGDHVDDYFPPDDAHDDVSDEEQDYDPPAPLFAKKQQLSSPMFATVQHHTPARAVDGDTAGLTRALPPKGAKRGVSPQLEEMKVKLTAIGEDFGFVESLTTDFEAVHAALRRKLSEEARNRQEEQQDYVDQLFSEDKIGYGDIGDMDDEFAHKEQKLRKKEEGEEYNTYLKEVFDPVYNRLQDGIREVMDLHFCASEMLAGATAGKDRWVPEGRPEVEAVLQMLVRVDGIAERRHAKVQEAVAERDRRFRRTVTEPLRVVNDNKKVVAMVKHFDESERLCALDALKQKLARTEKLVATVEQVVERGLARDAGYVGLLTVEINSILAILPGPPSAYTGDQSRLRTELSRASVVIGECTAASENLLKVAHVARLVLNAAEHEVGAAKAKVAGEDVKVLEEKAAERDVGADAERDERVGALREEVKVVMGNLEMVVEGLKEVGGVKLGGVKLGTTAAPLTAAPLTALERAKARSAGGNVIPYE